MFQFQIGAIKSEHRNKGYSESWQGFNSKLVRLKGSIQNRIQKQTTKFQFQIGAIKSSTCVQFYVWTAWFQFQIGAIKSSNIPLKRKRGLLVSIPNWCD